MIKCEKIEGRNGFDDDAFIVEFKTPVREGFQRFGGFRARAKATAFAVELLQELQEESQDETE
jgi:hypothetical protein